MVLNTPYTLLRYRRKNRRRRKAPWVGDVPELFAAEAMASGEEELNVRNPKPVGATEVFEFQVGSCGKEHGFRRSWGRSL